MCHSLSGFLKQFLSPVVCNAESGGMHDVIADVVPSLEQSSDLFKSCSCSGDARWTVGEHKDGGSIVLQGTGFSGSAEDLNAVLMVVQICNYCSGLSA